MVMKSGDAGVVAEMQVWLGRSIGGDTEERVALCEGLNRQEAHDHCSPQDRARDKTPKLSFEAADRKCTKEAVRSMTTHKGSSCAGNGTLQVVGMPSVWPKELPRCKVEVHPQAGFNW